MPATRSTPSPGSGLNARHRRRARAAACLGLAASGTGLIQNQSPWFLAAAACFGAALWLACARRFDGRRR
jgi:hypothetical protein